MAHWTSHWTSEEVLVKDFYISFKPLTSEDKSSQLDVSSAVLKQVGDEAIYAVITGRPDGFFDFLREIVGIPRRFEFVMSSSQCIQRIGSPSEQIFSSSQIIGLNTITVGLVRPLKKAFISLLISISLLYYFSGFESGDIQWIWVAISLVLAFRAAYLFFIEKDYTIKISESGDPVVHFTVSPSFLESKSTIIPLEDLNKLLMIFRVLKAK